MQYGLLTEETDLSPAAWLVERMTTFGENVASIIPEGFEAYARLFHPATRYQDETWTEVKWSQVAEQTGRTVHAEMQWEGISTQPLYSDPPAHGLWNHEPDSGNLPEECVRRLVGLLRPHTTTPERVWFLTWVGWGFHRMDPGTPAYGFAGKPPTPLPPREEPLPPEVHLPAREYYLLSGPIEGALETMASGAFVGWEAPWQSASLWWPEDRAWVVSTEIDFPWTYIGGTQTVIDAILDDPDLETLPAELDHGVDAYSDKINPPPTPPT